MKYSVFTAMMNDFTPEETARKIKSAGYDGVEWGISDSYSIKFDRAVKDAEYFKKMTAEEGLEISAIGTGLKLSEIEDIKKMFDICSRIGASQFRVVVPWYGFNWEEMKKSNYPQLYEQSKKELVPIEKLSGEYGIKAIIETHFGNICSSAGLTYRLVGDFDPKCIGVIYDPGNMIVEGRESWKMGLELLGDYLAHVHVKNLLWQYGDKDYLGNKCEPGWHWSWADIDAGMVDWQEVINALKLAGYDGYLSLEDFSPKLIEERLKAVDHLKGLEKDAD